MRKIILALVVATVTAVSVASAAGADPAAGNSGHSNNGSTQCKAGGTDHCPPFGP